MGRIEAASARVGRHWPDAAPVRLALAAAAAVAFAAGTPDRLEAALDPHEGGTLIGHDGPPDSLAVGEAVWPEARPVPRPEPPEAVEVSLLEPGAVLHGLLLPAEGEAPAAPDRSDALAGLFWLLAFLAALIASAIRIELRAHARRSAWNRRAADSYDA
jgi:hypothetical protein